VTSAPTLEPEASKSPIGSKVEDRATPRFWMPGGNHSLHITRWTRRKLPVGPAAKPGLITVQEPNGVFRAFGTAGLYSAHRWSNRLGSKPASRHRDAVPHGKYISAGNFHLLKVFEVTWRCPPPPTEIVMIGRLRVIRSTTGVTGGVLGNGDSAIETSAHWRRALESPPGIPMRRIPIVPFEYRGGGFLVMASDPPPRCKPISSVTWLSRRGSGAGRRLSRLRRKAGIRLPALAPKHAISESAARNFLNS